MDPSLGEYQIVRLTNGTHSVYSENYAEKMHPGLGPAAEADLLYVRQLQIAERAQSNEGEFVVWDVGLGAAANAVAVLKAVSRNSRPLRLISFDNTDQPLRFALQNGQTLGYLDGYEQQIEKLLVSRHVQFQNGRAEVNWDFILGDFPEWLAAKKPGIPPPHAILFDAFSPAKNPAMWTLPLFTDLFRALDSARPCNLTTYSRSTMFRVTLLLAGFFVGSGTATGMKEETTVASNSRDLISRPLDERWLARARRSDSAMPLLEPKYSRTAIDARVVEKLTKHPQFQDLKDFNI